MTAPSTFISPRSYQTKGGIPRRLLGGVLVVVVAVAMIVYWIASGKQPAARTSEDRARDRLADAQVIQAQPRGSSRSVDEAAEHAAAASRRAAARAQTAPSAATSGEHPATNDEWSSESLPRLHPPIGSEPERLQGWPQSGGVPPAGPPATVDPGASARELDARSSESRIFDEPAGSLASDNGLPARHGDRSGWPTSSSGAAASVLDEWHLATARASGPGISEAAADALRSFTPPANRNLAQRADEWQERVAGIVGASPPLVARPPAGPLVLEEGTVIPAVLTRRIDSEAPGVVTAMVNIDVYDTRTARSLLLPKGSRLVGRYNNDVSTGQQRLQFAFTRLILPDGSSFDLPGAVGSDALGQAGLEADVDRHFFQRFGAALLIGVIADHVVSPRAVPPNNAYGGGLSATGQVLVNTADAELHRNDSIAPTLTVPEGTRLNVEVVRDMVFQQSIHARS